MVARKINVEATPAFRERRECTQTRMVDGKPVQCTHDWFADGLCLRHYRMDKRGDLSRQTPASVWDSRYGDSPYGDSPYGDEQYSPGGRRKKHLDVISE